MTIWYRTMQTFNSLGCLVLEISAFQHEACHGFRAGASVHKLFVGGVHIDMHIMWHQMGKIFMPAEYNPLWSVVPLLTWFNFDPSMQNLSRIIQSHFRQLREFPYPSYSPRTREGPVAQQISRSGQPAESGAKISVPRHGTGHEWRIFSGRSPPGWVHA